MAGGAAAVIEGSRAFATSAVSSLARFPRLRAGCDFLETRYRLVGVLGNRERISCSLLFRGGSETVRALFQKTLPTTESSK